MTGASLERSIPLKLALHGLALSAWAWFWWYTRPPWVRWLPYVALAMSLCTLLIACGACRIAYPRVQFVYRMFIASGWLLVGLHFKLPWIAPFLLAAFATLINARSLIIVSVALLVQAITCLLSPAIGSSDTVRGLLTYAYAILSHIVNAPAHIAQGQLLWFWDRPFAGQVSTLMSGVSLWMVWVAGCVVWLKCCGLNWRSIFTTLSNSIVPLIFFPFVTLAGATYFGVMSPVTSPYVWLAWVLLCSACAKPTKLKQVTASHERALPESHKHQVHQTKALHAGALLIAFIAFAMLWSALWLPDWGVRKRGRIAFDEYHTGWEPIGIPYDTEHWQAGIAYTYYVFARELERVYDMPVRTINTPLSKEALRNIDVLIIAVPTRKYEAKERAILRKWVRDGGGLWLVGDHTNVFGSATYLNPIARMFGLEFRADACYPWQEHGHSEFWERPQWVWHPVLAGVHWFRFMTTCTIACKPTVHRLIIGSALRRVGADYSDETFFYRFPHAEFTDWSDFTQMAAVHYGRGRVVAFTDSTMPSSFGLFQPGVWELFSRTIEWLNRKNAMIVLWLRILLLCAGIALIGLLSRSHRLHLPAECWIAVILWSVALTMSVQKAIAKRSAEPPYTIAPSRLVYFLHHNPRSETPFTIPPNPHLEPRQLYEGMYGTVERIGLVPRLVSPRMLTGTKGIAVLITPHAHITLDEAKHLVKLIRSGLTLLWLMDTPHQNLMELQPTPARVMRYLHRALGIKVDWSKRSAEVTVYDSSGKRRAVLLDVAPLGTQDDTVVLLRDDAGHAYAIKERVGRGWVICSTGAMSFSTGGWGGSLAPVQPQWRERYLLFLWLLKCAKRRE
ncbi:MAG TPA: hypothetical protein EYP10_03485 [Armatimonadetes bacterium]|nr:hypothetical protein [Armatimonadota bacterium]